MRPRFRRNNYGRSAGAGGNPAGLRGHLAKQLYRGREVNYRRDGVMHWKTQQCPFPDFVDERGTVCGERMGASYLQWSDVGRDPTLVIRSDADARSGKIESEYFGGRLVLQRHLSSPYLAESNAMPGATTIEEEHAMPNGYVILAASYLVPAESAINGEAQGTGVDSGMLRTAIELDEQGAVRGLRRMKLALSIN